MPLPLIELLSSTTSTSCVAISHNLNLRSSTTMIGSSSTTIAILDDVIKQKKALRSKIRKELKSMDPIFRCREDDAIQNLVLEAPWFKSCRRLCAYISCSSLREVDTSKLLTNILKDSGQDNDTTRRKKLYVPRVEDKNSFMRMLHINKMDDLMANSMEILEPAPFDSNGNEPEDVMIADEPVDLLLIPGLAFDKTGKRLGRGGGYYDAFLKRYLELVKDRNWKNPVCVALSYSVQMVEDFVIPVTPSDVLVDAIVSPSGIIVANPAAKAVLLS